MFRFEFQCAGYFHLRIAHNFPASRISYNYVNYALYKRQEISVVSGEIPAVRKSKGQNPTSSVYC